MIANKAPSVDRLIRSHGEKAEFALGEILVSQTPGAPHGIAQTVLAAALLNYAEQTGSGLPICEWHHRFGPGEDTRVYVPDLSYLLRPRDTTPPVYAVEASDLMIEILSPHEDPLDFMEKIRFYLEHGAKSVWVVDPQKRRVEILKRGDAARRFSGDDVLTDELLPGFALPLRKLFR